MSQETANSIVSEIDFLPARFKEQNTQGKVDLTRIVVLAVLAAILPALLLFQYGVYSSVRGRLSDLRVRYNKAKIEETRLDRLREEFVEASAAAELYTFLKHPWPTTQLLDATTRSLPRSVTLTELSLKLVADESESSGRRGKRKGAAKNDVDARPAAQQDLDQLRKVAESGHWVLTVAGETLDTSELYDYIGRLADEPLFERADLESVQAPQGKEEEMAKFRARIVVHRGYGLPEGPTGSPAAASAKRAIVAERKLQASVDQQPMTRQPSADTVVTVGQNRRTAVTP